MINVPRASVGRRISFLTMTCKQKSSPNISAVPFHQSTPHVPCTLLNHPSTSPLNRFSERLVVFLQRCLITQNRLSTLVTFTLIPPILLHHVSLCFTNQIPTLYILRHHTLYHAPRPNCPNFPNCPNCTFALIYIFTKSRRL